MEQKKKEYLEQSLVQQVVKDDVSIMFAHMLNWQAFLLEFLSDLPDLNRKKK